MAIWIKTDTEDVDWEQVAAVLDRAGLSHYNAETQEKIFKNSAVVSFVVDDGKIVGVARALSDGVCQAAVYNVALEPEYHGRQLGRALIEGLLDQLEGCTITLYTHPQTIALYEKFGFRRQKTGFVKFHANEEQKEFLEHNGFLLPEGYRFGDNDYEKIPMQNRTQKEK